MGSSCKNLPSDIQPKLHQWQPLEKLEIIPE